MERFSPDFCAIFFVADLLMFLTCRSSIQTTTWFLLMLFEALCTKSFLILATFVCNLLIQAFALRQFFENFFLRAMRRCDFATFDRNFFERLTLVYDFAIRQGYEVDDTPVHANC